MEWIADPAAWVGLSTLVVLEIVLGIDNLIFIAILADKLPPGQRDRARQLGLFLALIMRLGLLASMSWLVTLTDPLFSVFGHELSGRDLILLGGGIFLLFKATVELHERLEGAAKPHMSGPRAHASFWAVVAQILVLDAVFSLDSVITAVGMVDELAVMMIAVVVAMGTMILASKPLTAFVNKHPTVVMLCLGFLLMIGFSLVAEGAGFHIPKGYLYGAIAFSVLIESFNQLALFNRQRYLANTLSLRERTAEAMLKLLGGQSESDGGAAAGSSEAEPAEQEETPFDPREQSMIRSVLLLGERPIQSLMTPRPDIVWVDLHAAKEDLLRTLVESGHSRLVVAEGELDNFIGVVQSRDMLAAALADAPVDLAALAKEPLIVPEGTASLKLMDQLRQHAMPMAIVVDEYGSIEGVITTSDLLAAIAGELADTIDPDAPLSVRRDDGSWLFDGGLPLDQMEHLLQIKLHNKTGFYTLAGLAMTHLQHVPEPGEYFELEGYGFTILSLEGRRIQQIEVKRIEPSMDEEDG